MSESGGLSPGKRWYMQVGNYLSVLFVLMFAVLTPSASQAPIAVGASASGQGQPAAVAADTLIPPDRLREDLNYTSSTLGDVHPALGDGKARQELARQAEAVAGQIRGPMSVADFYVLVTPLFTRLGDAHTELSYPAVDSCLPLGLRFVSDGLMITEVFDEQLPLHRGDQVLQLGGKTTAALLSALAQPISHENEYWVRARGGEYLTRGTILAALELVASDRTVDFLVQHADGRSERVRVGLALPGSQEARGGKGVWVTGFVPVTDVNGRTYSPAAEAGLKAGDRIVTAGGSAVLSTSDLSAAAQAFGAKALPLPLEVEREGKLIPLSVKLAAVSQEKGQNPAYMLGITYDTTGRARPLFGWRIDRQAGYGLFWLDSCDYTDEYRQAVDEFFAAVSTSGVKRVAIDLRRNGGGDSRVVDAFLKYLPLESVRYIRSEVRSSRQLGEQRGLSLWDRVYSLGARYFWDGRVRPERPSDSRLIFRGQVYVLTSWDTFSSATDMAAILSDNRLATVAGEPSGNSPTAYGDPISFTAPNTGLRFRVSTKRFTRPDPERDKVEPHNVLPPDVLIPTTIADIRADRDPVLEWLAALR